MRYALGWLRARLDETEQSTRALLVEAQRVQLALQEPRLLGREIPGWHTWRDVERMADDRLADLAAKRRILGTCESDLLERGNGALEGHVDRPTWDIVCLLALPYAGRDDFPDELRLP